MKYDVGDIVQTKKKHVCGSDRWEVLRTGAEIKLKCIICSREIMILKIELEKRTKNISKN
jgi:hypothetical protein